VPVQEQTAKFVVTVDGAPLPPGADASLASAFVDDDLNLPDLFWLGFRDPHRTLLADLGLAVGSTVEVAVATGSAAGELPLVAGEVTALEMTHDAAGTMTVVRGLDHSHRLHRGRVTETYDDVTFTDVARAVATRAGLELGHLEESGTVHTQVVQHNQTDWDFLNRLAGEIGFEVGCLDGRFEFRPPTGAAGGPAPGDLATEDPLALTLGLDLLRCRALVTAAEQVGDVVVRGWDVARKRALVGSAPAAADGAEVGVTPAGLAGVFGSPTHVGTGVLYGTQAEVDDAARAQAARIASAFAEIEGVARGNPRLRAGTVVSLGLAGEPFDGTYTLTSTRHRYDARDGYTVDFSASGRQRRSLLDLAGGPGATGPRRELPGVVPALVTDVADPEDLGRVKVSFPWLADRHATTWVRMCQPGAGPSRGAVILPEVNDEVLVAFLHGDPDRPVVIGSLYNGVDRPEVGERLVDGATGAVRRRGFVSKRGHKLVFLDDDGASGVMLGTGDGALRVALKETGATIGVSSRGQVEVAADGNVTITAGGRLELRARAGLSIDGGPLVEVKGSVVKLN